MNLDTLIPLLHAGLPIWVLTGGALLCLLIDSLTPKRGNGIIYSAGTLTLLGTLWFTYQEWVSPSPATNLLLMDRMSLFFIFIILFIGLISLFNSYSYLKVGGGADGETQNLLPGAVVCLILFSLIGMVFLFASDHLIVNFIGLETMSLAVYILVGSNRRDLRSNEAAIKYYVMGSAASAVLLYGIALLYGSFGTFQLSQISGGTVDPAVIFLPKIAASLVLTGLFFKLALVPFHFWVPDVYEGAPVPITGFMSTGVKIASFALFLRVLLSFQFIPSQTMVTLLSVCVILTLLVGNLGALVQNNIKRMLAYSSISHAGYLLLGTMAGFHEGRFDPEVTSGVFFYLIGYSFMTLGAFAVLSVMVQEKKEVTQFSDLTGLGYSRPILAAAFSLFMLSLLGIPPTVGFVAKYGIFSYAVKNGYIGLAVFGIIMSVVSAYYYLRAMVVMYFRGTSERVPITSVPFPLMFSLVFCTLAVIYLGVMPMDYLKVASLVAGIIK